MTTRQISTATWAGNLPDNLSYLAPTQFELLVKKLPNTKYFATGVNIPSVSVAETVQTTRLGANVKVPGDKITFGELSINFIVDENLENWTELYTWMEQTTGSTDPDKFRTLIGSSRNEGQSYDGSGDYESMYSDMTIVITTAANNPNRYVRIQDAFPTSLGEITMDTTVAGGITYVTCNASFQFTAFEIASTS
tara:strand:+ start:167 stop:748 length:582 start_codon:yes stop_codon:yes gene_type:complete